MKKLFLFASLISLASCEIYFYDDPNNGWDDRDLFIGNYEMQEYSEATEQYYSYSIRIQKSCCRSDEIKISNFYGADIKVKALVYVNKVTIPRQVVDGYEVEGTGKMINGKLNLTFIVRDLRSQPAFTDFLDAEGWPY